MSILLSRWSRMMIVSLTLTALAGCASEEAADPAPTDVTPAPGTSATADRIAGEEEEAR